MSQKTRSSVVSSKGFAQNIKQLESSYETSKRKRKQDDNDSDYLYGIVTPARNWYFLLYSPGEISQASEIPHTQTLRDGVKKVLGAIIGLIKDKACSDEEPAKIEGYHSKKIIDWCIII